MILFFTIYEARVLQSGDQVRVKEQLVTSILMNDSVVLKPDDILDVVEYRKGDICVNKVNGNWDRNRTIYADQLYKLEIVSTVSISIIYNYFFLKSVFKTSHCKNYKRGQKDNILLPICFACTSILCTYRRKVMTIIPLPRHLM